MLRYQFFKHDLRYGMKMQNWCMHMKEKRTDVDKHILMIFGLDSKEGKVGLLEPFQVCLTKWHVKGKRNIFTTRTHADVNKTPFFTWITNAPVNKLYISGLILKMFDSLMTFSWFVYTNLDEYSNH